MATPFPSHAHRVLHINASRIFILFPLTHACVWCVAWCVLRLVNVIDELFEESGLSRDVTYCFYLLKGLLKYDRPPPLSTLHPHRLHPSYRTPPPLLACCIAPFLSPIHPPLYFRPLACLLTLGNTRSLQNDPGVLKRIDVIKHFDAEVQQFLLQIIGTHIYKERAGVRYECCYSFFLVLLVIANGICEWEDVPVAVRVLLALSRNGRCLWIAICCVLCVVLCVYFADFLCPLTSVRHDWQASLLLLRFMIDCLKDC